MRRRELFGLLGGAVATWPLAARAQRSAKPVIRFLGPASPSTFASRIEAFRLGLRYFGYVEGTNITVEYRWADGRGRREAVFLFAHVRFWPMADIGRCTAHVRFWG